MKNTFITLLLILTSYISHADETIISDAGREILISSDGNWEFVSEDRYATNAAGERIRLKADGSWEKVSEEPNTITQHTAIFRDAPDYKTVNFSLDKVVIESHRSKSTANSKNTHITNQTVFYVLVSVPKTEQSNLALQISESAFLVEDSSGNAYPLLSISPAVIDLAPGEEQILEVRADGAPAWKYGKSYEFRIAAEVLNTDKDLVLEIPLSETHKVDVDGF